MPFSSLSNGGPPAPWWATFAWRCIMLAGVVYLATQHSEIAHDVVTTCGAF